MTRTSDKSPCRSLPKPIPKDVVSLLRTTPRDACKTSPWYVQYRHGAHRRTSSHFFHYLVCSFIAPPAFYWRKTEYKGRRKVNSSKIPPPRSIVTASSSQQLFVSGIQIYSHGQPHGQRSKSEPHQRIVLLLKGDHPNLRIPTYEDCRLDVLDAEEINDVVSSALRRGLPTFLRELREFHLVDQNIAVGPPAICTSPTGSLEERVFRLCCGCTAKEWKRAEARKEFDPDASGRIAESMARLKTHYERECRACGLIAWWCSLKCRRISIPASITMSLLLPTFLADTTFLMAPALP